MKFLYWFVILSMVLRLRMLLTGRMLRLRWLNWCSLMVEGATATFLAYYVWG